MVFHVPGITFLIILLYALEEGGFFSRLIAKVTDGTGQIRSQNP
jgi:hypothetical protein